MENPRSLKIDQVTFEIETSKSSAPSFLIKTETGKEQIKPQLDDLKNLRDFLNIYIYESNIYKALNENHREMRQASIN